MMEDFVEIYANADSESDEEFYGFEEFEGEIDSDDDIVEEVLLDDPTINAMQMDWLVDFDEETGPKDIPEDVSEIGCFELFFTDEVIELIVRQTNRYAREYIAEKGENMATYARARSWKEVSNADIRAFISILMVMGLTRKPSYESYWSSDPLLECKGFKAIMSRDRFLQILMFFHLNNNAFDFPKEDPRHDKLFKIRPLMDLLLAGWQRHYYPGREVSVDESMIAFKGRTALKQYMPSKPNKWGIKSWCLADSRSGYVWNWDVYTGKPAEGREFGLAHTVVTSLCEPIYLSGHHVYMDNFFSSPKLFQELAENGTGACGTLRSNRKEVPQSVKDAKPRAGDDPSRYRQGNLLYITWTDRRKVNLLTTIHNGTCFRKEVRTRTPPYRRQVSKPKAIQLYSQHMGGVDRADKQLQYYQVLHRSCKWWKKVFLYLLELCFSNAVIIFKARHPDRRFNAERFRLNLATGLLFGYERRGGGRPGRPSASLERPLRLTERHFLGKVKKTNSGRFGYADCIVCSDRHAKRHTTAFLCKNCDVPLCPVPCFERYHTLVNYKVKCTADLHE